MSNQQKCNNCGAKDHIAKFCYERTKKVPVSIKLTTQTQKLNSREKKEMKIQKKEEEIIIQVQKKIPQSKYEEDKYIGQHTQIWGSYWNEVLGWGFACCYSNQKSHRNAWEKRENDNPSLKSIPSKDKSKKHLQHNKSLNQDHQILMNCTENLIFEKVLQLILFTIKVMLPIDFWVFVFVLKLNIQFNNYIKYYFYNFFCSLEASKFSSLTVRILIHNFQDIYQQFNQFDYIIIILLFQKQISLFKI
ncbi:unnamed protein product [Paramecium pentaurelia]|uniref:Pre-mRNA-splicing factor SLU7 n=1 Tax=Paramecium pentaurelia TaxID=43138 RepID=A0A8S1VPZ5_9CILI|nr:unnamed protein product [Paramecium pentaurelia]